VVPLATEGGETFLGSNNPYVVHDPHWHGIWIAPVGIAEYREQLKPIQDELQRSEVQYHLAVDYLRQHPGVIPGLVLNKLWRWLSPITGTEGLVRLLVLCSYGSLLLLLMVGVVRGGFPSSAALHLVLMCTLVMSAITVAYWGNLTRGRLPVELLWLPWAAAVARPRVTRGDV
jgi:hypothetical protein